MNRNTVLNLTREKFRESENVVSICECYQISDGEHKNRLLVLVSSSGSHALFSIATTNWPPEFFSDLHVASVYRLDEHFRIESSETSTDTISPNRFTVHASSGQAVFYFNPCSAELPILQSEIRSAVDQRQHNSASGAANFRWTEAYEHDDLQQIDRHIADGSAPLMNRDSKWREELLLRQNEYMRFNEYRIYTATWNVNERPSPVDIDLHEWLSTTVDPPDIYAVAFQELDMNAKSIAMGETKRDAVMDGWINKVMRGLHPGAVYEELVAVRLVGMMLVVAVRRELRKNIVKVNTQTVGTGALNFMGNKGAVGVSFVLNEARICFVNSHLAAHTHEVHRRNENYAEIMRRMQFAYDIQRIAIEEHDHIFWIGDLNYRLTESLTRDQYDSAAVDVLLAFDQLHAEQSARRVFHNFDEGRITFRPTYKYDPGTDTYDSSEKSRPPAWCDRVLWKGLRIVQLAYGSVMQLRLSDHKPVYAAFTCGVKSIDEEKYNRVNADVLKHVDKYENDNQPQITVEKTDIDFREIRFNETYTEDFIVANNCHLPVDFEFRSNQPSAAGATATTPAGGISKICESWLNVEPANGRLITGKSMSIRLKLRIDAASAWRMHRKQKEPGGANGALDILVLHVKNGADIFITVMGKYRPSCFGFSIETLIRVERPVARMDLMELMEVESRADFLSTLPQTIQIPREVFLLVDHLYQFGMKTANLFTLDRQFRNDPTMNALRDQLDGWYPLEMIDVSPQVAGEALLMLLEASPDALVSPLEEECLYANSPEERRSIVAALSPTRKNVFLYVCLFLVDVLEQRHHNQCTLETLATLFGQAMLRGKGRPYRWLPDNDVVQRRTKYMSDLLMDDVRELVQREFTTLIREQNALDEITHQRLFG